MKCMLDVFKEAGERFPFTIRFCFRERTVTGKYEALGRVFFEVPGVPWNRIQATIYYHTLELASPAPQLQAVPAQVISLDVPKCTCDFTGPNAWAGCKCGAFRQEE